MAYFEKTKITDEVGVAINPATEDTQSDTVSLLRRILNILLAPLGYDKSQQRYRQTAILESGTVTTVTNLTNIGTYQGTMQIYGQNQVTWAQCVRSRIT